MAKSIILKDTVTNETFTRQIPDALLKDETKLQNRINALKSGLANDLVLLDCLRVNKAIKINTEDGERIKVLSEYKSQFDRDVEERTKKITAIGE